ncbi:response regulator containing CheY-like receiver domain and AraC-type DNA-binding domain [Sanguibacter keddieii DSM 10542]|uniref:Response regulator containing CheY-like receiver domain and AraC-type DNA-binding domain n=1 Tax=Sanguibacter keddieii (strain ATCC 51767 / DSM 10542 / NCFB 3025 / ST-74) TaxID=446469 RepID=D1BIJ7_SANKS|nr:response regulator [Sanguibacter keddieii]ACZ22174.1 response regulator containing CheY-like receiver domain and AraC-type DNA-binding domain [Sanguibacter keddieii DSM 10542]
MSAVPRAVIADDDADILGLVSIAARRAGVEIVGSFDNGDDAWQRIAQGGVDLAVLDISMPGLTGVEVAERIRGDASLAEVRIIMVSASVYLLERQSAVLTGADTFVRKPFSPRTLSEIIRSMIGAPGDA